MAKQGKDGPQDTAMHVGKAIFAALTHQEIADLLDNLFEVLPSDLHQQVLDRLSTDTCHTLKQILSPPVTAGEIIETADAPVSLSKQAEAWSSLWEQWFDIVVEATEEEGDYIIQDEHWEPPYFDEYTLAEDLETVAAKMLPLVQTAYENRFDPDDGFGFAIQDAESEIAGSLPEWMEIIDGFDLKRNLTLCFLTWEKLLAGEEGEDAFGFVQRVRLWEEKFVYSNLDRKSVEEFLSE